MNSELKTIFFYRAAKAYIFYNNHETAFCSKIEDLNLQLTTERMHSTFLNIIKLSVKKYRNS